jgi:predicted enzyme related to lactoylglutathione lyase
MMRGIPLIVYPVQDVARAKRLYSTLLGVAPYVDAPYYVGFKVGELEVGLDPNGHRKGQTGPITYWQVADIHAALQSYGAAGAEVVDAVKDVGGGRLIASIGDADGNTIWLLQM